jgi:hypothetical protein
MMAVSGYEVVLEDTILFPEGGGQVYLIHFIYPCHSCISNTTVYMWHD